MSSLHASVLLIAAREDRTIGYVVRHALEQFVSEYMAANLATLGSPREHDCGAPCASPESGMP